MRQITADSVHAFVHNQPFKRQNMQVTIDDDGTHLLLHGNEIAHRTKDGQLEITDTGWQTNTTKERLNAIPGVHIYQKNFGWYFK